MKKWVKRNKRLLISFAIVLLVFLIDVIGILVFIYRNQEIMNAYFETKKLTGSMTPLVIMSLLYGLLMAIGIFQFVLLLIRIIFPSKKTFSDLTMKEERGFIKNMFGEIKKDVIRDE